MYRNIKRFIVPALAILLIAAAALADGTTPSTSAGFSLPRNEELVYQAELSRSLLRGVDVAEFRLSSNREGTETRHDSTTRQLHTSLDAVSKGLLRKFFGLRFHQRIDSTIEPDSFQVLKTLKLDEQGDRRRESETVYDHAAHKLVWTEHDPN